MGVGVGVGAGVGEGEGEGVGVGTTAVVCVLVPCGEQPPMISADASNLAFKRIATPNVVDGPGRRSTPFDSGIAIL